MGTAQTEFLGRIRASIGSDRERAAVPIRCASSDRSPGAGAAQRAGRLLDRFLAELSLAGGTGHRVQSPAQARETLRELAGAVGARRAVMWQHPLLAGLDLRIAFADTGIECWEVGAVLPAGERLTMMAQADLGVTAVDYAVAETGSLVLCSRAGQDRLVSLLPPLHVALLPPSALVPSLDALPPLLRSDLEDPAGASNIVFITGPSRTADIELSLTQGVHGPKALHVIAWDNE
jgi:L-lactate dehydrogenase complex protein LldG